MNLGHIIVIILVLVFSGYDVVTDGMNGEEYLRPYLVYNVEDYINQIPDHCERLNSTTITCTDKVWGFLTLSFIQLPIVSLPFYFAVTFLDRDNSILKNILYLFGIILILLVPYPLWVWGVHIYSLRKFDSGIEQLCAFAIYGEASLESAPQLILQLYIIFSTPDKPTTLLQWLAVTSSAITITKASLELFTSGDKDDDEDPILYEKKFFDKIKILFRLYPAFLTSLVFKVGSLAIICTILRVYSIIYIGFGVFFSLGLVYWKTSDGNFFIGLAYGIFYGLTNLVVLCRLPDGYARKYQYPTLMTVSSFWLICHTVCLLSILIIYSVDSTDLLNVSSTRLADPIVFYFMVVSLLLLGPSTLSNLMGLRDTLKLMGHWVFVEKKNAQTRI